MIRLVDKGEYKLFESKYFTKILYLEGRKRKYFAWINIGEILIASKKLINPNAVLAIGKYRLYEVKKEEGFTDLFHLELSVGIGYWQGYLLPVGLPNGIKKRKIFPTGEIITKSI